MSQTLKASLSSSGKAARTVWHQLHWEWSQQMRGSSGCSLLQVGELPEPTQLPNKKEPSNILSHFSQSLLVTCWMLIESSPFRRAAVKTHVGGQWPPIPTETHLRYSWHQKLQIYNWISLLFWEKLCILYEHTNTTEQRLMYVSVLCNVIFPWSAAKGKKTLFWCPKRQCGLTVGSFTFVWQSER